MTPWTVCSTPSSSVSIFQAKILDWVAIPFSKGVSQPKGWTRVSCIVGRFFPLWASRKPRVVTVAKLNTLSASLDTVLCSFLTVVCVSLVFSCKNFNFFKTGFDVAVDFLIIPTWCWAHKKHSERHFLMEGGLSVNGFWIILCWLISQLFRNLTWGWTCFSSAFWHSAAWWCSTPPTPVFCFRCLTLLHGYTFYLLFCSNWVTGSFSSKHSRSDESRWAGSWFINASLNRPIGGLLDFRLHWFW